MTSQSGGAQGIQPNWDVYNRALRTGPLGAFISLALPAAAAAICGLLGGRQDDRRGYEEPTST